jgi:hypothetical protein
MTGHADGITDDEQSSVAILKITSKRELTN